MYITGAALAILLVFAIFNVIKWLVRWFVRRSIVREFEEELNNRIRTRIHLDPVDDVMVEFLLNANKSDKSEVVVDNFNKKLDRIREEERTKMLKEENFGLKP